MLLGFSDSKKELIQFIMASEKNIYTYLQKFLFFKNLFHKNVKPQLNWKKNRNKKVL